MVSFKQNITIFRIKDNSVLEKTFDLLKYINIIRYNKFITEK